MVPVRRRIRISTRDAYQPIPSTEKQTLKPNAIGFVGGLVIGLASTAPAYSLAAVIGSHRTPHVATAAVALLAILWYVPANFISQNFLFDSLSALALMIAFYYALSGIACALYYRHEITKSAKNFLLIGVGPVLGALMLGYLFVEATRSLADVEESYTGQEIFGFGAPLVIGYGFLLLGVLFVVLWRLFGHEGYFGRKAFESVDPDVAAGRVAVAETVGLEP